MLAEWCFPSGLVTCVRSCTCTNMLRQNTMTKSVGVKATFHLNWFETRRQLTDKNKLILSSEYANDTCHIIITSFFNFLLWSVRCIIPTPPPLPCLTFSTCAITFECYCIVWRCCIHDYYTVYTICEWRMACRHIDFISTTLRLSFLSSHGIMVMSLNLFALWPQVESH